MPKYIQKLISKRAQLAVELSVADATLTEWLEKNDILDSIETFDHSTGAEMYVNPWASAQRIMEAIEKKEGRGHEQMAKENPSGSEVQPADRFLW